MAKSQEWSCSSGVFGVAFVVHKQGSATTAVRASPEPDPIPIRENPRSIRGGYY